MIVYVCLDAWHVAFPFCLAGCWRIFPMCQWWRACSICSHLDRHAFAYAICRLSLCFSLSLLISFFSHPFRTLLSRVYMCVCVAYEFDLPRFCTDASCCAEALSYVCLCGSVVANWWLSLMGPACTLWHCWRSVCYVLLFPLSAFVLSASCVPLRLSFNLFSIYIYIPWESV